jgi:uncharacterized membrane protein YjjB (DUF3815 family)
MEMDIVAVLTGSVLAGLLACGMGILFTAPPRYIAPAFLCGFAGCFSRDVFISWGVNPNWSTAIAAAILVFVAMAIIREPAVPPVVLVSGALPLGAAASMFNAILDLMRVSSLKGEALNAAAVALIASAGRVFTVSLAIALGLGVGLAVKRFVRREGVWERV